MKFWQDESGAVTVDWVVMTSGVVALCMATFSVVSGAVDTTSIEIANDIRDAGAMIANETFSTTSDAIEDIALNERRWLPFEQLDNLTIQGNGGVFNPAVNNTNSFNDFANGDNITGQNLLYLSGAGTTLILEDGDTYNPNANYSLDFSAGDRVGSAYGGSGFRATIYAGDTAIGTFDGDTGDRDMMERYSFQTDVFDSDLRGEPLRVEIEKTGSTYQLNLDDVRLSGNVLSEG